MGCSSGLQGGEGKYRIDRYIREEFRLVRLKRAVTRISRRLKHSLHAVKPIIRGLFNYNATARRKLGSVANVGLFFTKLA